MQYRTPSIFRPAATLIAAALVLPLAACSDSGGSDGGSSANTDGMSETPMTMQPTATPGDTGMSEMGSSMTPANPAVSGGASSLYRGHPNSAVLQGPVIGDGSMPNADLLRPLDLEFTDTSAGLVLRDVSISNGTDSILARVFSVVENTSDEVLCLAAVTGDGVLAFDGSELSNRGSFGFDVSGAVATRPLGGGIDGIGFDSQCVLPGSTVYGHGPITNDEEIGGVRVTELVPREGEFTLDEMPVVPVSYTLGADGNIEVLIANRGSQRASTRGVTLILLDADGSPVGTLLGFDGAQLEPGAEATVTVSVDDFAGQVSTVRAVVGYLRSSFQ